MQVYRKISGFFVNAYHIDPDLQESAFLITDDLKMRSGLAMLEGLTRSRGFNPETLQCR